LLADAARIFSDRDSAAAEELLKSLDPVLDEYDRQVVIQLASDGPAREAVARALLYRYLKRITANAMIAGTAAISGLSMCITRFAPSGTMSSFIINLITSAAGCSRPRMVMP